MDYFTIPETAKVRRIIPKNSFDSYTNSQQKKCLTEKIVRITWIHKLSKETINLPSSEISEIQIFKIDLKAKVEIPEILTIIDKAIPYHIIFILEYEGEIYLSTSKKHSNPANENLSVIDWTFKSKWFLATEIRYKLNLKQNIDAVFKDLCLQLLDRQDLRNQTINSIIHTQKQIQALQREISNLESSIKQNKQFNKKVELNLLLKKRQLELKKVEREKPRVSHKQDDMKS